MLCGPGSSVFVRGHVDMKGVQEEASEQYSTDTSIARHLGKDMT